MFRIIQDGFRVPPVEPDEFMFAFALANAAASFKMPVENPAKRGLDVVYEDGVATNIPLSDRPINRASVAIAQHFTGDKFRNIMVRLFALHGIIKKPECSHWVIYGRKEIAASLLAAAARAPLVARSFKFSVQEIVALAILYERENGFGPTS
jgi:hypothetical protein